MWDDSALSEPIQDPFVSCDTSLMANCNPIGPTDINYRKKSSPLTSSVTELTQEFQLHSLQPQPLVLSTKSSLTTAPSRPIHLARKPSTSMHKPNQKRQHRPSLIRRQSSAAKISKLMALAQGLESSGYDACRARDYMPENESIPPQQIQPSSASAHVDPLSISSVMPSQRELESQGIMSSSHHRKMEKKSRLLGSVETSTGKGLVQKDIRLRTKWRGNTSGH